MAARTDYYSRWAAVSNGRLVDLIHWHAIAIEA
jgi:hypothetical protein